MQISYSKTQWRVSVCLSKKMISIHYPWKKFWKPPILWQLTWWRTPIDWYRSLLQYCSNKNLFDILTAKSVRLLTDSSATTPPNGIPIISIKEKESAFPKVYGEKVARVQWSLQTFQFYPCWATSMYYYVWGHQKHKQFDFQWTSRTYFFLKCY